jgi:short-subunit dehydrogenase
MTAVCPGFTHTSFHERAGLPPGKEGVPDWMWLDARTVVAASVRDAARGKAVSVPSRNTSCSSPRAASRRPAWWRGPPQPGADGAARRAASR